MTAAAEVFWWTCGSSLLTLGLDTVGLSSSGIVLELFTYLSFLSCGDWLHLSRQCSLCAGFGGSHSAAEKCCEKRRSWGCTWGRVTRRRQSWIEWHVALTRACEELDTCLFGRDCESLGP